MMCEKIIKKAFDIGMVQEYDEIKPFVSFLIDKDIKNIMEIGSYMGGSFYIWCQISDKNGKKISLDKNILFNKKKVKKWSNNIYIVEKDSHKLETIRKVKSILSGGQLDFLFIDGNHEYQSVRRDYLNYRNLVRSGGYICFHDINKTKYYKSSKKEVFLLWNEIKRKKKYKVKEFTNNGKCGIGLMKYVY